VVPARAVCEVLGIVGSDDAPLAPFVPPVVQVNVDAEQVGTGMVFDVTIRVRVRSVIPNPLPS